MPAHNRITLYGSLGSQGQESWTTSVAMAPSEGGQAEANYDDLLLWAQNAKAAAIADIDDTALAVALSSGGNLEGVRIDYVDAAGVVAQSAQSSGAVFPGSGVVAMPPQAAIVLSLETGRPGRSYRGRMYWPALGAGISSSLNLAGTTAPGDLAEAARDLLFGLANAAQTLPIPVPAVFSRSLNVLTPVSSLRVGDRVDTQRRRRNDLIETYTSVPYPG